MRLRWIYYLLPCLLFAITTYIHLGAPPEYPGEDITSTHRIGAAAANVLGPWGVLAVRLVGFPNRDRGGSRVFEPIPAILLTMSLALVVWTSARTTRPWIRALCIALYAGLIVRWFGLGLAWIASGRL